MLPSFCFVFQETRYRGVHLTDPRAFGAPGAVAIVVRSTLDEVYAGLPVVVLDSWSQLPDVFPSLLRNQTLRRLTRSCLPALDTRYWKRRVEAWAPEFGGRTFWGSEGSRLAESERGVHVWF